jgi:DNA-binding response OmpR family regulator
MAKILVIDDESNIRMMIRLALQRDGHIVELAVDGEDGLKMYRKGKEWDLILLDQRMPDKTGLEVLREIRAHDPAVRIVMITAFGTIDLAVDAMKAGATDFLRKPFTVDILRGAVNASLRDALYATGGDQAVTYAETLLNGFRIEFQTGPGIRTNGDLKHIFTVKDPDGRSSQCEVILPAYVMELVKAHADSDQLPCGYRFWESLCEAVLANYLWQQSQVPPDGQLRLEELTTSLHKWIDEVLSANPQ